MLKAITRAVSRNIARCELTYKEREPVDYEKAVSQHLQYGNLLRRCGAEVIELAALDEHPDCCFVADTAIVLKEAAIIASMGASSRQSEIQAAAKTLSSYRHRIFSISPPATLDGGDVIVMGREIFVGCSGRTNSLGIEALEQITRPFGYRVTPVGVSGSLHLTTACSAIDEETVLLNPCWIDDTPFARFRVLYGLEEEPWAASTVRIGETVCVEANAPRTHALVSQHCAKVEVLDISEFRKAEGSLPCLSILFHETNTSTQNKEEQDAE